MKSVLVKELSRDFSGTMLADVPAITIDWGNAEIQQATA